MKLAMFAQVRQERTFACVSFVDIFGGRRGDTCAMRLVINRAPSDVPVTCGDTTTNVNWIVIDASGSALSL